MAQVNILRVAARLSSEPLSDRPDYGGGEASVPRGVAQNESPPEEPYHFMLKRGDTIMGVMSFQAQSLEQAKVKMAELYKVPPGLDISVDGPYPGAGQ